MLGKQERFVGAGEVLEHMSRHDGMRGAVVQLRGKATDGTGFRELRGSAQLEANELDVLPRSRSRMMPGPDRISQQTDAAPAR